jgi:hypothetical protein
MTVAKLAWEQLDAKQRQAAYETLTHLPFFDKFRSERPRPDKVSEMEWVFLNAATWPDWLRDFARKSQGGRRPDPEIYKYHQGLRHYINLPVVAKEDADYFAEHQDVLKGNPKEYVVKGLSNAMKVMRSPDESAQDKAVALAWLLHLAGDIHQPLHCAAFFSRSEYPKGDQGGNEWWVKDGDRPTRLHTYWDDLPGVLNGGGQDPWTEAESAKFYALVASNQEKLTRPDFLREKYARELGRKECAQWAEEGVGLAEEKAYAFAGQRIKGLPIRDADLKLLTEEERNALKGKAPLLPEGYAAKAAQVANRQLALGGHRLADHLNLVFARTGKNH